MKEMTVWKANIHFDQHEALLESMGLKPTIIALTETWLQEDKQADLFILPSYQRFVSCNRRSQRRCRHIFPEVIKFRFFF